MRRLLPIACVATASVFAAAPAKAASVTEDADVAGEPSTASLATSPPRKPRSRREVRAPRWHEGEPVPAGYHLETHERTGLVFAGAATWGVLYVLPAGSLVVSGEWERWPLFVPVVGAFVMASRASKKVSCPDCLDSLSDSDLYIVDGVVQLAGAALLMIGFAAPTTNLVQNEQVTLQVVPVASRAFAGVVAVGRF